MSDLGTPSELSVMYSLKWAQGFLITRANKALEHGQESAAGNAPLIAAGDLSSAHADFEAAARIGSLITATGSLPDDLLDAEEPGQSLPAE